LSNHDSRCFLAAELPDFALGKKGHSLSFKNGSHSPPILPMPVGFDWLALFREGEGGGKLKYYHICLQMSRG